MTPWNLAVYLTRAGLGYGMAVISATAVTVILVAGATLFIGDGETRTIRQFVDDWATLAFIGLIVTAVSAFPGFVVALWVAARNRWTAWSQFAWAGCGDAVLAILLTGFFFRDILMTVWIMLACLVGGFAGGAVYWLAAGRFLANRWPAL